MPFHPFSGALPVAGCALALALGGCVAVPLAQMAVTQMAPKPCVAALGCQPGANPADAGQLAASQASGYQAGAGKANGNHVGANQANANQANATANQASANQAASPGSFSDISAGFGDSFRKLTRLVSDSQSAAPQAPTK